MWNILIADDHLVDRRIIKQFLKDKAHFHEAADGNEAILSYNFSIRDHAPFDIVLLDLAMPKLDGHEVLRRIRESEDKRQVPINKRVLAIAISALPQSETNLGTNAFSAYVGKPIDPKELLEKVEKVLVSRAS